MQTIFWLFWKGMWWGWLNTFCMSPLPHLIFSPPPLFFTFNKIFAAVISKNINYTTFNNLGSWSWWWQGGKVPFLFQVMFEGWGWIGLCFESFLASRTMVSSSWTFFLVLPKWGTTEWPLGDVVFFFFFFFKYFFFFSCSTCLAGS